MESGALNVRPLISHYFEIFNAQQAYNLISENTASLGIILTYPGYDIKRSSQTVTRNASHKKEILLGNKEDSKVRLSFVGSGNYATSVLMPAFKSTMTDFQMVASSNGVSSFHTSRKYNFISNTTDTSQLINDLNTDAVVITTRHDTHAKFTTEALKAGKHVFVEKPLCITLDELEQLETAYAGTSLLMVGFNRRFSPQVKKIKDLLSGVSQPKAMIMTVNAGHLPSAEWQHDPKIGGGRIIGEMCHFVDLMRFWWGIQ